MALPDATEYNAVRPRHPRASTTVAPLFISSFGMFVERVSVLPQEITARRNVDVDVRLGSDHGPDRPHSKVDQRTITGNYHAGAASFVLDPDFVVGGSLTESPKLAIKRITPFQFLREHQPVASHLSQRIQGLGGLRRKLKSDFNRGSRRLTVDRQKVVIIDPRDHWLRAGIYEAVLDRHHRLVFHHADRLRVVVPVSRPAIHVLSEFDPFRT